MYSFLNLFSSALRGWSPFSMAIRSASVGSGSGISNLAQKMGVSTRPLLYQSWAQISGYKLVHFTGNPWIGQLFKGCLKWIKTNWKARILHTPRRKKQNALHKNVFLTVAYLSISKLSNSWGLQKDLYVVRKVRTKLGSKTKNNFTLTSAITWFFFSLYSNFNYPLKLKISPYQFTEDDATQNGFGNNSKPPKTAIQSRT